MKKIVLFILMLFVMPICVSANSIYSIDIDVNLNKDGSANITEVWDVDGTDGTEWYKAMTDLGNMELSDFSVSMDGKELTYKEWDVKETLKKKKGYYGINKVKDGFELCFGKYDYSRHKFTLKYNLSNFVFNTNDSQVIYFNFIDRLSNVDFDKFSVTISSFYDFPDTLDVWGYGYKGYAYVSNGKIEMSSEGKMNGNYVVLLAKIPSETYTLVNSYDYFSTFDEVYNMAKDGTFEYDYNPEYEEEQEKKISVFSYILGIISYLFPFLIMFFGIKYGMVNSGYGYKGNKKIDKKNVPMYRYIPCRKNIYYANALIKLNGFGYNPSNIMGAIILKWVRNNKIVFRNDVTGIFNKETSVIDLTNDVVLDNELETELFTMMRSASNDGLLEAKELEKWAKNNYDKFLGLFTKFENDTINSLKSSGYIYKRVNKKDCKYKNVMNDAIYHDSMQLYGLKKYLEEFSSINTKEVMEVKLWDEYLMFAYLFGIADKVAKQLKNMYPEILQQDTTGTGRVALDYDTLMFVNHISTRSVSAATSARSAAESYSSGGGGFSSGGGGGGSFGGGGGGSR